jgi:hypothetical protein
MGAYALNAAVSVSDGDYLTLAEFRVSGRVDPLVPTGVSRPTPSHASWKGNSNWPLEGGGRERERPPPPTPPPPPPRERERERQGEVEDTDCAVKVRDTVYITVKRALPISGSSVGRIMS